MIIKPLILITQTAQPIVQFTHNRKCLYEIIKELILYNNYTNLKEKISKPYSSKSKVKVNIIKPKI